MRYTHPMYTPASVAAQARLPSLERRPPRLRRRLPRVGLPRGRLRVGRARAAASARGDRGDAPRRSTARRSAHEPGRARAATAFQYRHAMWLVDLDDAPDAAAVACAAWCSFDARDHLGDPDAEHPRQRRRVPRPSTASTLAAGASLMLANPRSFGYAFNPLTVYWCYDARRRAPAASSPRCTTPTASVTATSLRPDAGGRAPASTRRSTCRRSSRSTAATRCSFTEPGERARPRDHAAPWRGRAPVLPATLTAADAPRSGPIRGRRRAAAPVRRAGG